MRHIRTLSKQLCLFLLAACLGSSLLAEDQAGTADGEPAQKYRSGYSTDIGLGGPASIAAQLREDDEIKEPACYTSGSR